MNRRRTPAAEAREERIGLGLGEHLLPMLSVLTKSRSELEQEFLSDFRRMTAALEPRD
jgi:hypothetical protein